MNSAFLWIVFPLIIAGVLLLTMRWRTITALIAAGASLILAILAIWLPPQDQIVIWQWAIPFSDTFDVFGRQLVLTAADRPTLIVLYLLVAIWFGAVPLARPTKYFVPFGMAIVSLFTAAIAVEPFLFAAVFIEIAVLLSIPILSPPAMNAGRGVLRYLSFQTLGMPFVLISSFLFTGIEVGPGDPISAAIAIALLATGFALLLAVFPFHTWIPMLAEESHPYPAAFIFLLLPVAVLLLVLGFLDSFLWMKEDPNTVILLQIIGAVMVVTSGVWAAVERNLSRLVGFAIIMDIGFTLLTFSLAISSETAVYRRLFFAGMLPRGLSLGILALAMSSLIGKTDGYDFEKFRGLFKVYPFTSVSIPLALASLVGLPLMAGFPFKFGVIEGLSFQNPGTSIWVILGLFGMVIGIIRLLISLVSDSRDIEGAIPESRILVVFLVIGIVILVLIGMFPNFFLQLFPNFPGAFVALG